MKTPVGSETSSDGKAIVEVPWPIASFTSFASFSAECVACGVVKGKADVELIGEPSEPEE